MKTIKKENQYKNNPRKITEKEKDLLKDHLEEFGDLSGVVYCIQNKAFVGGNQRSNVFDNCKIEIVEKYEKPTKNRTVSHGFIIYNKEKYTYREVSFSEGQFKKACVVANNDGGSFDWEILEENWNFTELTEWGLNLMIADIEAKINNTDDIDEQISQLEKIDDENCKMPIIPKLHEKYSFFIIPTQNEIDEEFIRNKFNLTEKIKSKNGDERLSNIISFENIAELCK